MVSPKKSNDWKRLAGGMGAIAAEQSNFDLLKRSVLANLLWENSFYIDGKSHTKEIERLIPLCTPEEVFDLTVKARIEQKLRHTPLYMAVRMCRHKEHRKLVGALLPKIITRADMISDFLMLYWKDGKVPLAAQVKKGLAQSFKNFNEYQFAKYDRPKQIKLRDVMFLVRPKPTTKEEEELYNKIANKTLQTPDTWEVALSTGKDKKETWTRLIEERKIGGLAVLRNIANMTRAGVDQKVIHFALENLKNSMLLPLNFYAAYSKNYEYQFQIEEAMRNSYKNLPQLKGKTLFIVDVSGSMSSPISARSQFNRDTIACISALFASYQCEDFTLVATAGNDHSGKGAHEHISDPIKGFGLINQIIATKHRIGGGGIFTRQCLEWCQNEFGNVFERIIVFSDSQDCDRKDPIPKPFAKYNYICDVSAHTNGINYQNVWTAEISGWSEHFLTYIAAYEGLSNVLSDESENE